jgi:hypothetical protein
MLESGWLGHHLHEVAKGRPPLRVRCMNGAPALMLPLWVEQNHGEVIGMRWPGKESQQIAKAMGGNAGNLPFGRSGA